MGRLSQSPSPWGKAWNRPSLFSFSQSAEGLNQKAALLWAPVASALCVPSPGPEETLAEPGFLTPGREAVFPSGCQPPAKRRLLPPPLPAAPPPPKALRVGATPGPCGSPRSSLPARFSSSVWSTCVSRSREISQKRSVSAQALRRARCIHTPSLFVPVTALSCRQDCFLPVLQMKKVRINSLG